MSTPNNTPPNNTPNNTGNPQYYEVLGNVYGPDGRRVVIT